MDRVDVFGFSNVVWGVNAGFGVAVVLILFIYFNEIPRDVRAYSLLGVSLLAAAMSLYLSVRTVRLEEGLRRAIAKR